MKSDFSTSRGAGIQTFLSGCIPAPKIAETAELLILFNNLVSAIPTAGCKPLLVSTTVCHSFFLCYSRVFP